MRGRMCMCLVVLTKLVSLLELLRTAPTPYVSLAPSMLMMVPLCWNNSHPGTTVITAKLVYVADVCLSACITAAFAAAATVIHACKGSTVSMLCCV